MSTAAATAYIIHLEGAADRLPLIEALQMATGLPLTVFFASNGQKTWNDPTIVKHHPWKFSTLTQGVIGCVESHVAILQTQSDSTEPFFIFEDDAEFIRPYQDFIDGSPADWDILLLGANEYVESTEYTAEYQKIGRFWGAHAILIRPQCCSTILAIWAESIKNGIYLPPDWLYNAAISLKGLNVYGSPVVKGFFKQTVGLVSQTTGKIPSYT